MQTLYYMIVSSLPSGADPGEVQAVVVDSGQRTMTIATDEDFIDSIYEAAMDLDPADPQLRLSALARGMRYHSIDGPHQFEADHIQQAVELLSNLYGL